MRAWHGIGLGAAALACGIGGLAWGQAQSVLDTKHNLSASGPGTIRASSEQEICVFCHTPHSSLGVKPLWNRRLPATAYTVYSSSSLDANPGQPTGSSKMCLSCHDGTIAVGQILSRTDVISMSRGVSTLAGSPASLGTDLSDDHPISFRYTPSLALQDRSLADPGLIDERVRLDANGEMQCTTCHDPHDNSYGDFLVLDNQDSGLCRTCHQIPRPAIAAHDDCAACHKQHSAPSGPLLLQGETVDQTCLACHDGSQPRAKNILSDFQKFSTHGGGMTMNIIREEFGPATCSDCHDPHTISVGGGSRGESGLPPNLGQIDGVTAAGAPVANATFEYEVCYKCHADTNVLRTPTVSREIVQLNTRLEFLPSAVSYHPVQAPGRNTDVPSLRPQWSTSSLVRCSDCHGSDSGSRLGGGGAHGVHGSNEPPLLVARYETADFTTESASAYGLCYECHYRTGVSGVLSDVSFPHSVHVVDNRTTCSTCHDAHGIASVQGSPTGNTHLINFDNTIVAAAPNGRLEFRDLGTFAGSCTLTCHGVVHIDLEYTR
jgi:predicted CXXCH cytochrome family protein